MRTFFRIFFWIAGIASILAALLYFTILEPWTIPSDDPQFAVSIAPSLESGDTVIVFRSSTSDPGALVRCADPDAPGRFVVGRISSKAGAVIDIENGVVRIDNRSPPAPASCDIAKVTIRDPTSQEDVELACSEEELGGGMHPMLHGAVTENATHVVAGNGQVFLLSDNRAMHLDSRNFGQLSASSCNRILYRVWGNGEKSHFSMVW